MISIYWWKPFCNNWTESWARMIFYQKLVIELKFMLSRAKKCSSDIAEQSVVQQKERLTLSAVLGTFNVPPREKYNFDPWIKWYWEEKNRLFLIHYKVSESQKNVFFTVIWVDLEGAQNDPLSFGLGCIWEGSTGRVK